MKGCCCCQTNLTNGRVQIAGCNYTRVELLRDVGRTVSRAHLDEALLGQRRKRAGWWWARARRKLGWTVSRHIGGCEFAGCLLVDEVACLSC